MKKICISLPASVVLLLTQSLALGQGVPGQPIVGSGFDEWTVDCSPPRKGLPDGCYASVHYYPGPDDPQGAVSPARGVFMFSVDGRGVKFHVVKATNDACAKKPVKKFVDDQPIHTLSVEKQIEAVSKGHVYAFEYVDFPCTLVIKFITITGASLAYERMMTRWKNRDFSAGREVVNRKP